MRKRLVRLIAKLACIVFAVALCEGLFSALAYHRYGTLDVNKLNDMEVGNTFETSAGAEPRIELPHPFLGWIRAQGNNVGTTGTDFPLKRDPSKFTVLVTGGSVAFQLCESGELEKALNQSNAFGRPVIVLNGCGGAWRQPQQTIMLAMYGQIADAIVTLDGFNEHYTVIHATKMLEWPGENFSEVNPVFDQGYEALASAAQIKQLRALSRRHNSRTLFFLTQALNRHIREVPRVSSSKIDDIFTLSKTMPQEERVAFNMAEYAKYIRLMHAMSGELGIQEAHFIQPCPAISKTLTADEKRVVAELDYADVYQHMTDELLKLNDRSIPVVSLLDLYSDTNETIYSDPIHCALDGNGYRLMGERISRELTKLWAASLNEQKN